MDNESIETFNMGLNAFDDAKFNFNNKRYNTAINRAYYSVFYCARALLIKKGIQTKTHTGTIHKFGLEYVVNGKFNGEIASILSHLFNIREKSDYTLTFKANEELTEIIINEAEKFIDESEKYL
ncbi:MAG: HEPN domain-containing protein [Methanobrevibacter sp.]|nr:HEPN domain-containing protein [Candidatus Methanoflexus mossambicus]